MVGQLVVRRMFGYDLRKSNNRINIGALVIMVSVVCIIVLLATRESLDERTVAEVTVTSEKDGEVHLDEGEYDIYLMLDGDPLFFVILAPDGSAVFDGSSNKGGTPFDPLFDSKKVGTFNADSTGTYQVAADGSKTLYFAPAAKTGLYLIAIIGLAITAVIGSIMLRRGLKVAVERGEAEKVDRAR